MLCENLPGRIYQAIPGFEDHLEKELGNNFQILNDSPVNSSTEFNQYTPILYYITETWDDPKSDSIQKPNHIYWHQNCWPSLIKIKFDSINEAVTQLRNLGRNWCPVFFTQYRRGTLIQSKLPSLPNKRKPFPWLLPDIPMGAYTLLDANTIIACPDCSSPFPGGRIEFEEDKINPPGRAYLKLWEALILCRKWPKEGDICLDAGAAPGSWSYVLSQLGADITAIDKAPLDPKILAMKGVKYIKHDVFTLKPEDIGKIDWLLCDVISYPPKLYDWINKWLMLDLCDNFICTIKMQGDVKQGNIEQGDPDDIPASRNIADFNTPLLFAGIPGSKLIHLWHNKHELTWIKIK